MTLSVAVLLSSSSSSLSSLHSSVTSIASHAAANLLTNDRTPAALAALTWNSAPATNATLIITIIPLYLTTIYALKKYIRQRSKPFELTPLVVLYNLSLSIFSLFTLLAGLAIVYPLYQQHGLFAVLCDDERFPSLMSVGPMVVLYWVCYVSKYVELCDTMLLIARGKPIIFLHVYHHAATIVLCWTQVGATIALGWVVLLNNMLVHTIMYLYFALSALKIEMWWKKYLTMIQIIQFCVDLIVSTYIAIARARFDFPSLFSFSSRLPSPVSSLLPTASACRGTWYAASFGVFILVSYLALFVLFYSQTYDEVQKTKKAKKKLAKTNKNEIEKNDSVNKNNEDTIVATRCNNNDITETVDNGSVKEVENSNSNSDSSTADESLQSSSSPSTTYCSRRG